MAYPFLHQKREKIIAGLLANNIEIRPLIAGDMSTQPMFTNRYPKTRLPNCEYIENFGFYLPNHPNLTTEDINLISDIILSNIHS